METKTHHTACNGNLITESAFEAYAEKCTAARGCGLYGCPAESITNTGSLYSKSIPPYVAELHKFLRDVKDSPKALRGALYAGIEAVSYPDAPALTTEEMEVLKSYTGSWVIHSESIRKLIEDIQSKTDVQQTENAVSELRKLSPNLRHRLWKRNFCHCNCECQKQEETGE